MYSTQRGNLSHKPYNTGSDIKHNQHNDNFHPNKNGIYIPNKQGIYIPNGSNGPNEYNGFTDQSRIVAQYSYRKYPNKIFNEKLSEKLGEKLTNVSIGDRTSKFNLQNEILLKIREIETNIKKNIKKLDKEFIEKYIEKPIENQTEIPRLNNINETSKTLSVLYSNVSDQTFIQNVDFHSSVKSFYHTVKESPCFKEDLVEFHFPIFKSIVLSIDNIYKQLSVFNLKKALYSMDSNMPFYCSNESGAFRSYEFLQTIECIHREIMPGTYYTKTIRGAGDLYYKDPSHPDFLYLELKTGDLPATKINELLSKMFPKYSDINNLILCFDIKSQDQQDQITDYLIKYQISNVTSIFINNYKFYENNEYYNYDHALQNPVNQKTLDFFYKPNLQKQHLEDLQKQSLKNKNKINLIESEDKLDQLVDSEILDKIKEYQEVGNIKELINPMRLPDLESNNDEFEFNSE